MPESLRDHIGVTQPKRLDLEGEPLVKTLDLVEMPLELAKAQLGMAIRHTLKVSKTALKEIADPSLVVRVCEGDKIPDWLARLWVHPDRQRALVEALAEQSGQYRREVSLHERKVGT